MLQSELKPTNQSVSVSFITTFFIFFRVILIIRTSNLATIGLSSKPPADDEEDDEEESRALTPVKTPDFTSTFDPDKLKPILEVRNPLTCGTLTIN